MRALQVLPHTDDTPEHRARLDLHRRLSDDGFEVRTVALAPGRRGELAGELPVLAPGRRSLAACTELGRESRWADVLVLCGGRAMPPLAAAPWLGWSRPTWPPVVVLTSDGELPRLTLRMLGPRLHVAVVGRGGEITRACDRLDAVGAAVTVIDAGGPPGDVAAQLARLLRSVVDAGSVT